MDFNDLWDFMSSKLLADDEDFSAFEKTDETGFLVRTKTTRVAGFLDAFKNFHILKGEKKLSFSQAIDLREKATKVIRKLFSECTCGEVDGVYTYDLEPALRFVEPCLREQFYFDSPTKTEYDIAHYTTKGTKIVTLCVNKNRYVAALDAKIRESWDSSTRYRYYRNRNFERVYQIDLARFIAELSIVSEYRRYFKDRLSMLSYEELMDNVVFSKVMEKTMCMIKGQILCCENDEEFVNFLTEFLPAYEICPVGNICTDRFVLKKEKCEAYMYFYKNFDFKVSFTNTICLDIFAYILEEYGSEKEHEKYLRGVASDYAHSYEDKKNISQKYLDAAKNSLFKKVFKHVEYDEDVDLERMEILQKEFMAVMNRLGNPDLKSCELRFRKLGHHHASGLYYPALRCICVDIRQSESFIHELFHCLDFINGELSVKAHFFDVKSTYEKLLRDYVSKLPKDSLERKRLDGQSKYNLDYYLEPTEIFARCAEMYVGNFIDNALNESDVTGSSFCYPDDPELLNSINEYFSWFFEKYLGVKTEKRRKCPPVYRRIFKMKQLYVENLGEHMGETLKEENFLLESFRRNVSKAGKEWFSFTFSDVTGKVIGKMWSENILSDFDYESLVGSVVKVSGVVDCYDCETNLTVHSVKLEDGEVNLNDYTKGLSEEEKEMLSNRLNEVIDLISDEPLKELVKKVFSQFGCRFYKLPAGKAIHHAYNGALMVHTLEVVDIALALCDADTAYGKSYTTKVNRDLVIAGALFHDLGKIVEYTAFPACERTVRGVLNGHLVEGVKCLNYCLSGENKVDAEMITRLEHIIMSSHNGLGGGSKPMFKEAIIVSIADDASCRVDNYDTVWANYDKEHPGNTENKLSVNGSYYIR